ncbi:transporter substrate-binding domain-containing protein [Acinetobacter sp. B5B]|uniref:transporter substrate-binding domain-containing protein n=1 Tax=Acinetobacter baretiae TaxID=2605383 RepID=UPI0018C2F145|nr:transporter substrate-binding domain-containing protein [Acinetobacter baretiae]MBF7681799.1 transporter substrate-binding domain-containing protein [Acinetobacter baretiae]MBF7685411.1 transporter substrate-binding domain-containing protein [Acinetobacter baretiae]
MKTKLVLSSLLLTTLMGCSGQKESEERVIKIGATGTSYPSAFKQDGKLVGFDVEVAETVAKKLNYKVEWVNSDFSGLMGQLEAKKIDTVANVVAITPEREQKYLFTQPYAFYSTRIVTHQDNTQFKDLADLKNKTIAGVLGSNNINVLKDTFGDSVKIRTYETRDIASNDVIAKRVEGYVNSGPILSAEIKSKNLPLRFVGQPLKIQNVGFPFNKDEKGQKLQAEFEQELKTLQQDGSLKALSEKYFGEDITDQAAVQNSK